jgi:hypothetical protein
MFIELAGGLDDRTWEHHRNAADYSQWIRESIRNDDLAREVAEIEHDAELDAKQSREHISEAISRHYTAPAREEN